MTKDETRLVAVINKDLHSACKELAKLDGRVLKEWLVRVLHRAVVLNIERLPVNSPARQLTPPVELIEQEPPVDVD